MSVKLGSPVFEAWAKKVPQMANGQIVTTEWRERIAAECDAVKTMLLSKNEAYGNSALDPMRVFSAQGAVEQLCVRIDDKLSRLKRGKPSDAEDTVLDLIGYLVLLRVAQRKRS